MSEEMEKRQKGEQFRVVDPAVAPSLPFKPDVQKIMIMALALGLGLGGGLAYLKESLDPGFYTQEEIEAYLDTEVVVSFPIVESVQRRKRKKIR
jgi:capsular polysaccharide biosynthesis protein